MTHNTRRFTRYAPMGTRAGKQHTGSTKTILEAAEHLGVAWKEVVGINTFQLQYKNHREYFYDQVPSSTTALAARITTDKRLTRNYLKKAGIPVPKGFSTYPKDSQEYTEAIFEHLHKPLVIKPSYGMHGTHVHTSIADKKIYRNTISFLKKNSNHPKESIIIEEQVSGTECRFLCCENKVIGVIRRVPAHIIGDGSRTISQLIKEKNNDPKRGRPEEHKPLTQIIPDQDLMTCLKEHSFSLESTPAVGQRVMLRNVSNISKGGDSVDVTDEVSPKLKKLALKTLGTIPGLYWAGIDIMFQDKVMDSKQTAVVIEINTSPGLDIHDHPYQGENRHASEAFVRHMFPEIIQ